MIFKLEDSENQNLNKFIIKEKIWLAACLANNYKYYNIYLNPENNVF